MKFHNSSAPLDRDDDDNFPPSLAGEEPSEVVPEVPAEDFDIEADDELLEAELGEHDADFGVSLDLDDDLENEPCEDDDDESEMFLLHDLGIDLDAPDEAAIDCPVTAQLGDVESIDDEAAA